MPLYNMKSKRQTDNLPEPTSSNMQENVIEAGKIIYLFLIIIA